MMFWQDVLLGCRVSDAALRNALAAVLGIPTPSVRIVDMVSDSSILDDGETHLVVERAPLRGEFPLHVSLYVNEPLVEERLQQPSTNLERLARLCELLGCAALVSDDALDPASWLRVLPSGLVEQVMLD